MTRAERRRADKEALKKKTKTYNLTLEQLDTVVSESVAKEIQTIRGRAIEDTMSTMMILLLSLPQKVLKEHYWPKTYEKKLPDFTDMLLDYFIKWQNGDLDILELKAEAEKYGKIGIEENIHDNTDK